MTLERLDAGNSSLVVDCRDGEYQLCYLGCRLPPQLDLRQIPLLTSAPTPHGELDCTLKKSGFPTQDGHSRAQAALKARRGSNALLLSLKVTKLVSSPSALAIHLQDTRAKVHLRVTLTGSESGVFSSQTTVTNTAPDTRLDIDWLASVHIPLPPAHNETERYGGFWANELLCERTALTQFGIDIESNRGRSSHQSFPTLISGESGFSQEQKNTLLTTLEWSGNHRLRIEASPTGGHTLQAGMAPLAGELSLAPGEEWTSPAALFALSDCGINGLREQFRCYWLGRKDYDLMPSRPVHFNSWESSYFDHDARSSCQLIDDVHALGAERFVLDDGWMQGRVDIGVGLGDWIPCPTRYPKGLKPVAEHARALGLSFGVWVEPEMLTLDSRVAQAHPDWIIGNSAYAAVSGRQQYLLNICLPEARNHILGCLDRLIQDCNPDYLKWDMNRDYAQVGFTGNATPHAMTKGWYELLTEMRSRHPRVIIESCAAGGARTDAGALAVSDRIWPSDSMDPLQRFAMMKHASSVVPPALLGTHVGVSPSSTSGAHLPLSTRCIVALLGHMGIELNPQVLDDDDRAMILHWTTFFKAERAWLGASAFYYLDEIEPGLESLFVYNSTESRGLLFIIRSDYPRQAQPPVISLPDCVAGKDYDLELLNPKDGDFVQESLPWHRGQAFSVSGDTLRLAGLRAPFLRIGHCALIQLTVKRST